MYSLNYRWNLQQQNRPNETNRFSIWIKTIENLKDVCIKCVDMNPKNSILYGMMNKIQNIERKTPPLSIRDSIQHSHVFLMVCSKAMNFDWCDNLYLIDIISGMQLTMWIKLLFFQKANEWKWKRKEEKKICYHAFKKKRNVKNGNMYLCIMLYLISYTKCYRKPLSVHEFLNTGTLCAHEHWTSIKENNN